MVIGCLHNSRNCHIEIDKPLHINNFYCLYHLLSRVFFLQGSIVFHCFLKMEERGLKRFCRLNRQFYFETEANNSGCVHNVVKSWGALLIFSSMVHGSELERKSLRSPTCVVLFWPAKLLFTPMSEWLLFWYTQ